MYVEMVYKIFKIFHNFVDIFFFWLKAMGCYISVLVFSIVVMFG